MAEPRRPRAATAEKRARLLDAAERIMLHDGYAAVTSRRVEAEAGIKLHYHFGTLDDLFVEVFRRRAERNVERLQAALTSPEPLRAWWRIISDSRGTALLVELTAAANHRAALQAEVAKLAHDVSEMQIAVLGPILADYGIDTNEFPPALVAAAAQGLALVVVQDEVRGFDTAHREAVEAMARLVDQLEQRRTRSSARHRAKGYDQTTSNIGSDDERSARPRHLPRPS
jgi:AcrR family transcriptional regulator